MAPVHNSSGPEPKKMLDRSSSSLGLHCQKMCEQISSNLISQMSQRHLLASLQAPFLKEKKGVRFSALYLQQKRNLLVLDHSHQQVSYFFHARSVVKWINVDQLRCEKEEMNRSFIARSGYRLERETFSCHSCRLTLSADLLRKALNVTPADSAHPFESPPAGKTDITFTRRRVPSNWLMKMKFNRLLNLIWMIMSTIYNKTTRKLPVVEVKGKGSATDRWIIASQDETTGPSVHPEDATSTKMVRETLSHADAESGGNSEKINSETDTEILNVGSNSEQSHVALAGPNPEHMQDVFLATNYPKDTFPISLSFTHRGNKVILRVPRIILVILPEHLSDTKVFTKDGNPTRAYIKQALGLHLCGYKEWCRSYKGELLLEISMKLGLAHGHNSATIWNECYDNEDELESFRHKARQQDKVYEEREESCWILHLRTGIFYPKGHEGVMNEVPDGAAIFASSYWLRNSDMYRV
ncbi:hypothetical protein Tco_0808928 [Tanacetum coccineum]